MDASLDTNVIIHLYKANFQQILFSRFNKLKIYEYIRNHELKNHAEPGILELFDNDVKLEKIEIITDAYLKKIGMFKVFEQHVKEIKILFNGSDLGEVYAIAIAETLGCISLVTDDIKEYGPHYTLMRIADSDVMPFAFYEILFLDYLEGLLTEEELYTNFNIICSSSELKMNCSSKLRLFMKRFWKDPYSESEKEWMKMFCIENNIDAKQKVIKLNTFLRSVM